MRTGLRCPLDGQTLYRLTYQSRIKRKPTHTPIDWFWCQSCNKPVQVKVMISSRGFSK